MNLTDSKYYGGIGLIKEKEGLASFVKSFKAFFIEHFPPEKDGHFFHHTYSYKTRYFFGKIDFYIRLWEFLDLDSRNLDSLRRSYYKLSDSTSNRTKKEFSKNCERFIDILKITDKLATEKVKYFNKLECYRMYEAMECLNSGRNLSSVVMSVSSVEHRLHILLAKINKRLYEKEFEKVALGGIIELFRRDSRYAAVKYKKFKEILPIKHLPLMEMLNIYRIFSAHPKDELISSQTAKNIISLSFLLLLDPVLTI